MGTCISSDGDTHTKKNRNGSQLVETQSDVVAASTSQPDVRNPLGGRDSMLGSSQVSQESNNTNGSSLENAALQRTRSPAFSAIVPLDTAAEDHDDDSFPSNSTTNRSPGGARGANRDLSTGTSEFSTGFSEGDFSFASDDRSPPQQRNMSLGSGFQSLDGYINDSAGSSRDLLKSRLGAPPNASPHASSRQQQQQQQSSSSRSPRLETLQASEVAAVSKSLDVKLPQALNK